MPPPQWPGNPPSPGSKEYLAQVVRLYLEDRESREGKADRYLKNNKGDYVMSNQRLKNEFGADEAMDLRLGMTEEEIDICCANKIPLDEWLLVKGRALRQKREVLTQKLVHQFMGTECEDMGGYGRRGDRGDLGGRWGIRGSDGVRG